MIQRRKVQVSKTYEERRRVRQGDFEYLVDDGDRTAWISEGHCGGVRVYTMPEKVTIEGVEYTITSAEFGAYRTPHDTNLEEVYFPDNYEYFDEYTFCDSPLRKVRLGKGFRHYTYWTLRSAVPDVKVEIDADNPYIKMSDDGHMVLSKDGKKLIYLVHDIEDVFVPEGVKSVLGCAISCNHKLKRLHMPGTLKEIATDGIMGNVSLERLMLCSETVVMADERDLDTLPLSQCHLAVPRHLIPQYRSDSCWGKFKYIDAMEDLDKK